MTEEIVGERIENVKLLDRNDGSATTTTLTLPGTVSNADGTTAVNWFAFTKELCNPVLFHHTNPASVKDVPVTVRLNDGLPAGAELGERPVITGGKTTKFRLAEPAVAFEP
jgi:hypothetical protein